MESEYKTDSDAIETGIGKKRRKQMTPHLNAVIKMILMKRRMILQKNIVIHRLER